jgi:hypothetical protein
MKKISLILLMTSTILISGCATTTNNSVSGVERSQFLMLPASSVITMSGHAYNTQHRSRHAQTHYDHIK